LSEIDPPRRPGPWDLQPTAGQRAPEPTPARPAAPDLVRGQHPAWAAVSSALLVGYLWWVTGSWVIGVAGLWGILVHEYGHVLAMNRVGMGPARIHIVPFLGGLATGQRNPKSEWDGVLVSLAGPAFGLLAMIPLVGLWMLLGGSDWLYAAFFIGALNLLNLVPAAPLDGSKAIGPVLAKVHPLLERAVLVAIGVAVVWWGVTTGRLLLAVFLGIAVLGHLRSGGWRPATGRLSAMEAGKSVGLFLVTGLACAAASLGVLLPLADGSVVGALDLALRFVGVDLLGGGRS
jgi:Zn-dependent protease